MRYCDKLAKSITFKCSSEDDVQEDATIVGNVGNAVGNTVGNVGNVIEKDLDINDPKRRKPDITLAKELLGWEPKVALKEGLARTIEYFRG